MDFELPIAYNSVTKKVELDKPGHRDLENVIWDDAHLTLLETDIKQLNELTQNLISLNQDVPESPMPSPQLSIMVKKFHANGLKAIKEKKFQDAVKMFSLGLNLAVKRNKWETFKVTINEVTNLLNGRCDSYILLNDWPRAQQDADLLLNLQVNTFENFSRRSLCFLKMGLLDECKADLERGLAFFPNNLMLKNQLKIAEAALIEFNGDS
ncbi:Sec63 complex subunit SEC72 ASCRUDRAFT_29573 [Ascoidea rubescens DSM 1968]|uniref:TPR-like protein n=1 Tax=Ascoidea rubescens DSM 1968 TaxID=1344418 RepID=A0A1D2VSP0_9ASCO|nr:hypothetical protein ASCRUDRAFT_29573 [Ascoidea rubescens DSM 1968]ODV64575.1 hypothetical protein ASCRUDRAFT_29573 [Ascoidea rubescens DSM 1968]